MNDTASVLVVGAGPTGLTLACHLLRAGVSCRVIDRAVERRRESKALGVHARTLEIFSGLDVSHEAIAAGVKTEWLTVYVDGRSLVRLPYKDLKTPYPFMLILPQHETERILEERFVALGGTLERGVSLTTLTQDDAGVHVVLAHAGGAQERIAFSYAVGCDGAKSAVRDALPIRFDGADYDETFVLADLRLGLDFPRSEAIAFASKQGVLVVLPLPDGRTRLLGPAGARLAPGPAGPLDFSTFERIVRDLDVVGDAHMSDPTWVARFNVHRRIASSYRIGRVLLAGDAAHIHSPAGGQGMNVGIQDATNLAWKLALVIRGLAGPWLLDTYESERRPVALATLNGTDSVTKLAMMKSPLAIALRNIVVPFVVRRLLARRMLLAASQLGTQYPRSAIVVGASAWRRFLSAMLALFLWLFGRPRPSPGAGERAPPGGLQSYLDGRFHTLLMFVGHYAHPEHLASVAQAVASYDDQIRLVVVAQHAALLKGVLKGGYPVVPDRDESLHRRYGASFGRLYLVRPDGYIGFVGSLRDVRRLGDHLGGIFRPSDEHASFARTRSANQASQKLPLPAARGPRATAPET